MPILMKLDAVRDAVSTLELIREVAARYPGDRPLQLEVCRANGQRVTLEAGTAYRVSDDFATENTVANWVS